MSTASDPIYTPADLADGAPSLRALTPPARLAVIGDPVAHSRSPGFHNAALKAAGIDAQYIKLHVSPEEAANTLRALPQAGFFGTNVTIPHKATALATVDEADDYARQSGAVNTVVVQGEKLLGFNTDGPGFVRAIREEFSVDVRDLRILILGAGGGAGRAIAVQCARERCERLVLANRTVEKAQALAAELSSAFRSDRLLGPVERLEAIPHEPEALRLALENIDLVVNASSVGMRRTDPAALPSELLNASLMVYDTVYANGETRLLEDARQAGARAANGLSMLLHQGALSFEIWFDRPAPLAAMRAALSTN